MVRHSHTDTDNSKKTILLAEDEATIREPLRMVLERAGFSALVAEDGQEALRIASEHPDGIDLLVSDVQMPGMGGPDLAMVLRRYRPELRILLVSADPQRRLMLENGWNFLQKPFPMKVIVDRVCEILSTTPS